MNLLNEKVIHSKFGTGTIIAVNGDYLSVAFPEKTSPFVYPDAFAQFLTFVNPDLQREAEREIAAKAEEKRREQERKAAENQAELARSQESQRVAAERQRRVAERDRAETRNKNLAFKCNYCDGGCGEDCVGFKGLCSEDQMRNNINVRKYAYCTKESNCKKYLNGEITREQLEQVEEPCYEAVMLTQWKAKAGKNLRGGARSASARRIRNARVGSLAVLTTMFPGETDRFIFAVFIIGRAVEGNEESSGFVQANEQDRIELTPAEARQMSFWNYHRNADGGQYWGSGLYRGLEDSTCLDILSKIVSIKKTDEDKEAARAVLAHYCESRHLSMPTDL